MDTPRPGSPQVSSIGVVAAGVTLHGFALNVSTDLSWFQATWSSGIPGRRVTSLAAEGVDLTMAAVVARVVERAAQAWDGGEVELASVDGERTRPGRLALPIVERKPQSLRVQADMGPAYQDIKRTMHSLDLVTVCEEAGCPNIFECWNDGTATFMVNGDRSPGACKLYRVEHPAGRQGLPDPDEPAHVAEAVASDGTGPRRGDRRGPGRPARWRGGGDGRDGPGDSSPVPVDDDRGADPRLQKGDPLALAAIFEVHCPTSSTTTWRRWPACNSSCVPVRTRTCAAWPCWGEPVPPGW